MDFSSKKCIECPALSASFIWHIKFVTKNGIGPLTKGAFLVSDIYLYISIYLYIYISIFLHIYRYIYIERVKYICV